MHAARGQGLTIPKDLSIIGFDNSNYAHYLYPKLCTIDYPVHAMGRMAAQWVLKHIYNTNLANLKNVFEPKLVWRDSVLNIKA